MKRTLALILTVMMVLCMIPASLLSALANGPGVGVTDPANLSLHTGDGTWIPETVQVDGILDDTGWDTDGWFEVNSASGTWDVKSPRNNNFEYEYQLHRNETFFYGAYSINVSKDSIFNGELSSITVWLNSDDGVSGKYTEKVEIKNIDAAAGTATMTAYDKSGTAVVDPTDLSTEVPAGTNGKSDYYTVSDSTRIAVKATTVDGVDRVVVEFRINMDNFDREGNFRLTKKITAFSQVKLSGSPEESLYYPRLATSADRLMTESPESSWPETAHVITQSDVRNDDGMADYNNVLPTDINIDGRFTEGGWVNMTDRYTAKNEDGIGYSIDDYRRSEDYDNGYVTDITDVKYSLNHAVGTSMKAWGASTIHTLDSNYVRFKYNIGLNKDSSGNLYLVGGVVVFADDRFKNDIYCNIMFKENSTNKQKGMLTITYDDADPSGSGSYKYYGYAGLSADSPYTYTQKSTLTWGAARHQTYTNYLVNFEFCIPYKIDGTGVQAQDANNIALKDVTDLLYLIEVTDSPYSVSANTTSSTNFTDIRNTAHGSGEYWANSDWRDVPTTVTRHYNDTEVDGELAKDTWQCLNSADPYIDGAAGYQGAWKNEWSNIRTDTKYYYEVYADYDYLYGAVIINDNDGWNTLDYVENDKTKVDTFTLWVYNNTVVDQQYYNFAISFYNTANSTNTFDGTKTGWDVSAWYKNASNNSPLVGVDNQTSSSTYTKGDKQIAGIEAVMRRIDTKQKAGEDDYYDNDDGTASYGHVLEFKIPISLLYYDQAAGADAYSPAVAFGYYTSVSAGGVNALTSQCGGNLGSATIAHPMPDNHAAGLDRLYASYDQGLELYNYAVNTTDKVNPMQSHYLPSGYRWAGPDDANGDGDTADNYETLKKNAGLQWVTAYEINDRVFDPKRIYSVTCRQIRSDASNDGWVFGRVIDNFKLDGKLEEVYWNQEEEIIAVNGETGYWDNLPSGNTDFDYGYRVYTGREYVYGAVKVNATSIKELEFIGNLTGDERNAAIERNNAIIAENNKVIENTKINIWFNSAENISGNTNATHRFTFWLVDSVSAKCEAVNLVTGLDMPLSGTVLEEGFATSGTKEDYVRYEVKTINNDIVVEFMIDLDLLNLNNASIGKMDYARDGYEYVVGVTHPVEDENISLYHLDDTKTFWMTGYNATVDNAISGWEVAPSAGMVIPKGANCAYGIPSTAYVIGFNPTEYAGVYEVDSVLTPGTITDTTGWGQIPALQPELEDGGFVYVFNPGTTSGEGVANITSSYATGRGLANITDFTTVGTKIKFEDLVLDTSSLAYNKNEATYTYCGMGNFDTTDDTFPYNVIDGLPNDNHKNAHLKQNDTGYISVPQYSKFDVTVAKNSVLSNPFENSWGTASPALEVTYLDDYITEKIQIDGLLNDQGWMTADWVAVDEDVNGNRQTVKHTSGKQKNDGSYENEYRMYEYAVRTDGEYFYVAGRIYMPIDGVYSDGTKMLDASGKQTVTPSFRLWVNDTVDNGRSSYDKLFDIEAGVKHKAMTFDFLVSEIDTRTNYYQPDVVVSNSSFIKSPVHYDGDNDATVTSLGEGQMSLVFNNYNLRVSQITANHKYNPNAGSGDAHYTLKGEVGAAKTDLNYRQSSFYGETVIVEENLYNGYDYDDKEDVSMSKDAETNKDVLSGDSWVAERHLKSITYGSEHATMRADPENHNITLVEYKIKLSELDMDGDGSFEYGFHTSAIGRSDSGNDYLFFYPMVVKEVAQDISKYDRFHMPMWFWSNTSLVYNQEFEADIMMKSTYAPVTEIGAQANTVETDAGDIQFEPYTSTLYAEPTSAIRLGAYYDHDYIRRFMRDQGIENYNEWDYWDVYEMGVLIFPAHGMSAKDADGNTVQADHDEFLNVTAEDRYYKLGKGVKNVEADLIEKHEGGRFCDYENFVFYAAMVLSPDQAKNKAYNNLKYSYRGYVDFYGNDLYNDEFEGWPSETDPFLQYYYNNDKLYKVGTFTDGIREDVYVNDTATTEDHWGSPIGDGLSSGGAGFDADKATINSTTKKSVKLPNLATLTDEEYEKYGLDKDNLPLITDTEAVKLGEAYKDGEAFTLKRFSLSDKALYKDFYSDSMIRSVEIVREIASRKGAGTTASAVRKDADTAGIYYVPSTWDPIGDGRVTHLANSAGYTLDYKQEEDTSRAVLYVGGTDSAGNVITVDTVKTLAGKANVVATTDNATTASELKTAGITTIYNSNKNVLGMLGMAAIVSEYYGNVSVDVDYYGASADVSADKDIIDPMLSAIGVKNSNVANNSLNILVLSTISNVVGEGENAKTIGDYNDNLLAKLADNLASNVPTVVIDMTGEDGLTYNDEYVTPITETMHLARLLGYSSMPDASEAAAIGIAQGIARYAYLAGVKTVNAETNTAFLKSLTYSLVNDIAFGEKYENAGAYTADDVSGAALENGEIKNALKVQAFQFEAEKIVNQLNGSGILVWIDANDGNESENADACILIGTLNDGDGTAPITGDEASFEMLMTSGVNIARKNYSVGKTSASYTADALAITWADSNAALNGAGVLTDGETTTKVWDYLLPDSLSLTGTAHSYDSDPNTVPSTETLGNESWAQTNLNINRGIYTSNRWFNVNDRSESTTTKEGAITLTLGEGHTDLSAIRLHLANCSKVYCYMPDYIKLYYKVGTGSYTLYNDGQTFHTVQSVWNGLNNFTYWATMNLSGLDGQNVTGLKIVFGDTDTWGALIDEVEVYTTPSTTKTATTLQVGTFNVGHCENIDSGSGSAFGLKYTGGGDNVAGGIVTWQNYTGSNASTTVTDVENVGKFIKNSAGTNYDVMFIQEAAQYFGSDGGSHIWGNCNQMKILSEYSGYEYYAYARGDKNPTYLHGAENAVSDDTTTMLDDSSVGVGILSKYPVVASGSYEQQNGQVIAWARINVGGQYIDVFSTHFDSNQYRTYDKYMMRHNLYQGLKRVSENSDAFIIGGDFNEVYLHTFEVVSDGAWTPVLNMKAYVDYQEGNWYDFATAGPDLTNKANLKDNVNEYYMGVKKTANAIGETNTVVYNNLYTLSRHRKIVDNIMFGGDEADIGYQTLATDWSSGEKITGTNGIKAKTYEPTTVDYDPSTTGTQKFGTSDHRMLCYSFSLKVPTTNP